MRDKSSRIIACFALSGALLLGIGIGIAEAHVSKLERDALAAFEADARPIILDASSTAQAKLVAGQPYIVEVSVTTDQFMAAREAQRKRATL